MPDNIVGSDVWRFEDIAGLEEHVSAVVERDAAQRFCQGNAGFEVDDSETVATDRYGEWGEGNSSPLLLWNIP